MFSLLAIFIFSFHTYAADNDIVWTCEGGPLKSPLVVRGYFNDDESDLHAQYEQQDVRMNYNEFQSSPLNLATYVCASLNVSHLNNYVSIEINSSLDVPEGESIDSNLVLANQSSNDCIQTFNGSYARQSVLCRRGPGKMNFNLPKNLNGLEDSSLRRTFPLADSEYVVDLRNNGEALQILVHNDIANNRREFQIRNSSGTVSAVTSVETTFENQTQLVAQFPDGGYLLGFVTRNDKNIQSSFLLKLLPNGQRDPAFGKNGELAIPYGKEGGKIGRNPAIAQNGDIYLPSEIYYTKDKQLYRRPTLFKIDSKGVFDTQFSKNFDAAFAKQQDNFLFGFFTGVLLDNAGRLVIYSSGHAYSVMAQTYTSTIRFQIDGTFDPSYHVESRYMGNCDGNPEFPYYAMGKGVVTTLRCNYRRMLVQAFDENGNPFSYGEWQPQGGIPDDYFGSGASTVPQGVLIDKDRLYIGGHFYGAQLGTQASILRLVAKDGSLDESFGIHGRTRSAMDSFSNSYESPRLINRDGYVGFGVTEEHRKVRKFVVRFFKK